MILLQILISSAKRFIDFLLEHGERVEARINKELISLNKKQPKSKASESIEVVGNYMSVGNADSDDDCSENDDGGGVVDAEDSLKRRERDKNDKINDDSSGPSKINANSSKINEIVVEKEEIEQNTRKRNSDVLLDPKDKEVKNKGRGRGKKTTKLKQLDNTF